MADCTNGREIIGLKAMALYINKDVRYNYPDASKENEVDIIAHAIGSFLIDQQNEEPKWERTLDYSGNYNQNYNDEFTFFLHGIQNNVPAILKSLRNNRLGYIVEIITTGNQSYVFPAPVFLNDKNTKKVNSHSWTVSLSYRVPTDLDKLDKLNTILMAYSYILGGNNTILGGGGNIAVISN